jgi:mRNA interferase HigB
MWIIKPRRVTEFIGTYPTALGGLEHWLRVATAAKWRNLVDVRKTFPHADEVKVKSGRTVVVFNIKKNDFRLITAIHYNIGKVFVLMFLTHAEYDKEQWKGQL